MIRSIVSKTVKTLATMVSCAYIFSAPANATYYGDWDVGSDASVYTPVAFGEDITLNACGSTLFNVNNQSESYSICDLPSVSKFRLMWYRWGSGLGYANLGIYDGENAVNGLTPLLATGAGTYFPVETTYYIGLWLIAEADSYIDLPGGGQAYTGSGTLGEFQWSAAFQFAAPVSEPAALLLLLPGLAYIARRQRRRKQAAKISN